MILCKYSVGIILLICLIVSVSPISAYSIETQNDSDSSMLSDMDVLTSVDPMETLSTNNTNNSDTYPKNKIKLPNGDDTVDYVMRLIGIGMWAIGVIMILLPTPISSFIIPFLGIKISSVGAIVAWFGMLLRLVIFAHWE